MYAISLSVVIRIVLIYAVLCRQFHQQEADVVVAKTGGDVCRLQSDNVTFETDLMLVDSTEVSAYERSTHGSCG